MTTEQRPAEARKGFRVLAGIISVLIITIGLPASIIVAVRNDPSMWLVAFPSLIAGIAFGTVAFTGRWLCFKGAHAENNS